MIRLNRYINHIISMIDLHVYKLSQSTSKKVNNTITVKFDMTQFSETALKPQECEKINVFSISLENYLINDYTFSISQLLPP